MSHFLPLEPSVSQMDPQRIQNDDFSSAAFKLGAPHQLFLKAETHQGFVQFPFLVFPHGKEQNEKSLSSVPGVIPLSMFSLGLEPLTVVLLPRSNIW